MSIGLCVKLPGTAEVLRHGLTSALQYPYFVNDITSSALLDTRDQEQAVTSRAQTYRLFSRP
jgi:hypothetical protein